MHNACTTYARGFHDLRNCVNGQFAAILRDRPPWHILFDAAQLSGLDPEKS